MLFVTCLRCHLIFGRLTGRPSTPLCPVCTAHDVWREWTGAVPLPPLRAR